MLKGGAAMCLPQFESGKHNTLAYGTNLTTGFSVLIEWLLSNGTSLECYASLTHWYTTLAACID